jgi:putative MATE family efflux protein
MDARGQLGEMVRRYPAALDRLGLVDEQKAGEAFELAIPLMITSVFWVLIRVTDVFMVGIAEGDVALAGLQLGSRYFYLGDGIALALSSGTLSVVSRLVGGDDHERASLAIKQSLLLSTVLGTPMTVVSVLYAEPLVAVLSNDPRVIDAGATYLRITMLAVVARFWTLVFTRSFAASGNTRTPMFVRVLTLPVNVAVNAVLIFGLGPAPALGIEGAAWGLVAANLVTVVTLCGLLLSGRYEATLYLGGRQLDLGLMREIVRVALPLSGMRLVREGGRFPFLFVLGILGTPAVAAYAVAQQVTLLAMMPAWGFSTAASSLVGQHIGKDDTESATDYCWQTLRIALVTQCIVAAAMFVFARPVAASFGTEHVDQAVAFIRVLSVAALGFSIAQTTRGGLRGAGDTRWPFYGTFGATYLLKIPIAALALPVGHVISAAGVSVAPGLGLGFVAVYAALLVEFYVRALVNTVRFRSGRWRAVAAASRARKPAPSDD